MPSGGGLSEEHLRYFVSMLAIYADATFDSDDWIGLEYALFKKDESAGERSITWPLNRSQVGPLPRTGRRSDRRIRRRA